MAQNLISKLPCIKFRNLKLKKQIGAQSVNGSVYSTNNDKYVVKLVQFVSNNKVDPLIHKEFANEVMVGKFMRKLQPRGIKYAVRTYCASKIIPSSVGGVIVMDNAKQKGETVYPLADYKKTLTKSDMEKLKKTLLSFWTALDNFYIMHGDLHAGNIFVVKKNGKVKSFRIIDFGSVMIMKKRYHCGTNTFTNVRQLVQRHYVGNNNKIRLLVASPYSKNKYVNNIPYTKRGRHFNIPLIFLNSIYPKLPNVEWLLKSKPNLRGEQLQ